MGFPQSSPPPYLIVLLLLSLFGENPTIAPNPVLNEPHAVDSTLQDVVVILLLDGKIDALPVAKALSVHFVQAPEPGLKDDNFMTLKLLTSG